MFDGYLTRLTQLIDCERYKGSAISLNDSKGNAVPNMDVYAEIYKYVIKKAEDYEKDVLLGVFLRISHSGMEEKESPLSSYEIDTKIWELIHSGIVGGEPQEVKAMGSSGALKVLYLIFI